MIISANTRINFPRSLVYATYRDKLKELVPYMSNVRDIQVTSRRQEGEKIYTINEWHGGGEIPSVARAFLSDSMLSWTEYNTWNAEELSVDWKIQTHAFTEAVKCGGKNIFLEDDQGTLIESRGELKIEPQNIQGVPFFLVGQVASVVEDFLSKKIEPNLSQMSEGVRLFLEKNLN
jgi:hypothetical protein